MTTAHDGTGAGGRSVVELAAAAITPDMGLRERKKLRQTAQIAYAANELFMEHGFDNVTLNQVADACDISVRTVLRYYVSKESLGIAYEAEALERFKTGLRHHRGSVLGYWRYHVGRLAAEVAANADWHRRRREMILSTFPLRIRWDALIADFRRFLADAIAAETDGSDRLGPELMAAMMMAGNQVVERDWLNEQGNLEPQGYLDVIDYAEELFAHRLVFTKRKPASAS